MIDDNAHPSMISRPSIAPLVGFYFLTFGLFGIDFGYLPLYVQSLGFSPFQISVIASAYFIATTFFSIPWNYLADRFGNPHRMMVVAITASLIFIVMLPSTTGFWEFAGLFYLYALFQMVTIPQLEALTVEVTHFVGVQYGTIRVMGTLGVMCVTVAMGWMLDRTAIAAVMTVYVVLTAIQWCISWRLPKMDIHRDRQPTLRDVVTLAKLPPMRCFLLAVMFNTMSCGLYFCFFSIWLSENGYTKTMIGWMWFIPMAVEALVLWKGHHLFKSFRSATLIMSGLIATVVRWAILCYSVSLPFVAISQSLNLFTFGCLHLAAMRYIRHYSPPYLRQSGQALYQSASFGIGAMMGTLASGVLVTHIGIQSSFAVTSIVAMIGVILFWPAWRYEREHDTQQVVVTC